MWQSLISQESRNQNVNRGQPGGSGYSVGNAIANIGNRNVPKNKRWIMNMLDFGGGLSQTLGMTNKEEEEIPYDPYWAYTPEQKAVHQALGPYLQGKMGGDLDLYKGDYTADLTQGEQDVISQNARLAALGEQGLGPLLRAEFPEQYYRDTLYQPALKNWQEDVLPLIQESYAGPGGGGFYGTSRGNAVAKSGRDLTDTLAAQRAQLAWNVQQNVPNAINAANALSTTGAAIQSTPRLIKQYGLDKEYEEWTRGKAESQKYIDQAIDFMGLSSGVMDIGDTDIPYAGNLQGIGDLLSGLGRNNQGNNYGNYVQTQTQPGYGTADYYNNYPTSYNTWGTTATPTYTPYQGLGNTYNQSALGAMDWRSGNVGNYRLGSGMYQD